MVFSTVIITLLEGTPIKLGNGLLVIIIMIFMRQAETIIRNIFGFGNAKSLGDAVAAGALVASSISAASKSLGALKGAQNSDKGGKGASKGGDKKPALRDTSNVGGAQGGSSGTSGSGSGSGSTNQSQKQTNSGNTNSSNNSSSSSGSNNSSTSANDSASSSSGNSTATQASGNFGAGGAGGADATVERQERTFNTEAVDEAQSKFKKVMGYYIGANVKAIELATGVGLGGAMGGDVPSMFAGANFAKAGINVTKIGGQKVINGFKNSKGQRNKRITQKTNDVIDSYNDLKSDKNWSNDRMLDETERVLKMKDTSKIKDEKLRKYAETVQDLRTEYEDEYQVPNDMVLDRVSKIQQGTVRKDLSRRYTRNKNDQNGQNGQ